MVLKMTNYENDMAKCATLDIKDQDCCKWKKYKVYLIKVKTVMLFLIILNGFFLIRTEQGGFKDLFINMRSLTVF